MSENRAGKGQPPQLTAFRSLIAGRPAVPYGQIVREAYLKEPNSDTRIWVDDINGDGKFDLLLGDLTTLISPADELSEAEFKQKFADWQKAVETVSKELGSSAGDEKQQNEARERFQKLYSERSKFMKEDRTGFVWLYLQK